MLYKILYILQIYYLSHIYIYIYIYIYIKHIENVIKSIRQRSKNVLQ